MTIFYRMCDVKSPFSNPSPFLITELSTLNEYCLRSTVGAYKDISPKIVFLCDFCPKEVYEAIIDAVPFEKEVYWTEKGINETCLMQYELAEQSDDDVFIFQECDYLYRPGIGKYMSKALLRFGLVSPYDNLNFYKDPSLHSSTTTMYLDNNIHYRSTERNTMTFGMRRDVFVNNVDILKKWGYLDGDVWYELKARGQDLFVPIPSFATHLAEDFMAPGVDWESVWKTLT